jgi:hypothetical protein
MKELKWRVHTPNLIKEVLNNPGTSTLVTPLKIFLSLMNDVAVRASQLNDAQLNALMCRLTLYQLSDLESPNYDQKTYDEIMESAKQQKKQENENQ